MIKVMPKVVSFGKILKEKRGGRRSFLCDIYVRIQYNTWLNWVCRHIGIYRCPYKYERERERETKGFEAVTFAIIIGL